MLRGGGGSGRRLKVSGVSGFIWRLFLHDSVWQRKLLSFVRDAIVVEGSAAEQVWHMEESQGQILALAIR